MSDWIRLRIIVNDRQKIENGIELQKSITELKAVIEDIPWVEDIMLEDRNYAKEDK